MEEVNQKEKLTLEEEFPKIFNSNALGQILVCVGAGYQYSAKISEILGKSQPLIKKQIDTLKELGILLEGNVEFGNIKFYTINEEFLKLTLIRFWIEGIALSLWKNKLLLSQEKVEEVRENLESSGFIELWFRYFKEFSKRVVSLLEKMNEEEKVNYFDVVNLSLSSILNTFLISFLILSFSRKRKKEAETIIGILAPYYEDTITILEELTKTKHDEA